MHPRLLLLALAASLTLAGCNTTGRTSPEGVAQREALEEAEAAPVGSHIRRRKKSPTTAPVTRLGAEQATQQMNADRINPTGDDLLKAQGGR